MGREPCLYPCDVQQRFPDDHMLSELGAESYMGLPLYAVDGTPIGLLALLKNSSMSLNGHTSEVLSIVAAQAGAELGRQQAEAALKASEAVARKANAAWIRCSIICRGWPIAASTMTIGPCNWSVRGLPAHRVSPR